jgi:hypothetical protein
MGLVPYVDQEIPSHSDVQVVAPNSLVIAAKEEPLLNCESNRTRNEFLQDFLHLHLSKFT